MSQPQFSREFFIELGLTPFQMNAIWAKQNAELAVPELDIQAPPVSVNVPVVEPELESINAPVSAPVSSVASQLTPQANAETVNALLIGPQLAALSQPDTQESKLWQAILSAMGWQSLKVRVCSLEDYQTEDRCQDLLDWVVDSGVEQVFAMAQQAPVIEMLAEGLEVVYLPSLAEMLVSPQAKKQGYLTLMGG